MHENRFEKQIRKKMDQLQFDPSEDVWTTVNLEINGDKKRRRPLFWLFFFSGMALMAGGYYFVKQLPGQMGQLSRNEGMMDSWNVDHIRNTNPGSVLLNKAVRAASARRRNHLITEPANGRMPSHHQAMKPNEHLSEVNDDQGRIVKVATIENVPAVNQENKKDSSSGKRLGDTSEAGKNKTDTVFEIPTAKAERQQTKSRKWQFGFDATGGFSKIQECLLTSGGTNSLYYSSAPGGIATGAGYMPPSEITPGFSFGAGVFVKRSLSKRFSVLAGLDYQYYSTKTRTGYYVSPNSGSFTNSYYRTGNVQGYTNLYHFITMPLSISIQLNKSKRLPVSLMQTASVSYLLNSRSLYYDPTANIYYENNQVLNKTQIRMATAIMIGFPFQHSAMAIGPQIQYGLTGLLKKDYLSSWPLFYSGLTFTIIPGKK